jgi:hypothetical protein
MFKLGKKKSSHGIRMSVRQQKNEHDATHTHRHTIRELFVGHRTLYSLLGATIGGIFVGRSLWQISVNALGLGWTIVIGVVLFVFSSLVLHSFQEGE